MDRESLLSSETSRVSDSPTVAERMLAIGYVLIGAMFFCALLALPIIIYAL